MTRPSLDQCFMETARLAYHFHVAFGVDQRDQSDAHDVMIVRDEDANFFSGLHIKPEWSVASEPLLGGM